MADPGVAGKKRETAIMYCIMVSYAVFMTLVGAVLTSLLDEFGLPIARGGMFYSTQNVGSFLGILLSGVVIDRYGKRKLILLIYAGFIAPLLSFLVAGSLPAVLCVLFLAGMAAKLIDAILNARVSEMYAENKAFHLNLLHCCFAVGCLLGPLLAGAVLRTGMSWRVSYFSLGVVCLVLFFVYALVVRRDGGAKAAAPGPESAAGWSELSRPRMLLLCLAILFYSLYEGGISNWLPTYLTETLGVDKAIAGSSISALWFGLIVSRLAGSVLAKRLGERSIVFIGASLGGIVFIASFLAATEWAVYVGAALAGLFAGTAIPMIITIGYTWFPGAQGKVSMMLYLCLTFGSILSPLFIGLIGDRFGLRAGMVVTSCFLLCSGLTMSLVPSDKK